MELNNLDIFLLHFEKNPTLYIGVIFLFMLVFGVPFFLGYILLYKEKIGLESSGEKDKEFDIILQKIGELEGNMVRVLSELNKINETLNNVIVSYKDDEVERHKLERSVHILGKDIQDISKNVEKMEEAINKFQIALSVLEEKIRNFIDFSKSNLRY